MIFSAMVLGTRTLDRGYLGFFGEDGLLPSIGHPPKGAAWFYSKGAGMGG